jgi:predicted RNase H-like HicB family nuclease
MRDMKMDCCVKIPVTILREGKRYVAYTPALDISTSGKSYSDVKRRFEELIAIFLEELLHAGTTDRVLKDLGWNKVNKEWSAPVVVGQEATNVCVPA